MVLRRQLKRLRAVYYGYPGQFWVLILGTFIDQVGGALIYPFLTLYVTRKFNVGMTEVGLVFGLFSISSVVGSTFGGALTDRLGRKAMLIFGLVTSASATLMMGLANSLAFFLVSAVLVGLLAHSGVPAQQAMVADLLPPEKRTQGFGILRVVGNLAVAIGPAIGGFLAAQSYLLLFVCDVVVSLVAAAVLTFTIRETRPEPSEGEVEQTMVQTLSGYRHVLRDVIFVAFMLASVLKAFVAMQLTTTLPVFLRDVHGVSEQGFGYVLSLNAAMVVLLQFPIARWISRYRPLLMLATGMALYALGYGLYGFVGSYVLFLVAVATLTVGEMMTAPVSQSLVTRLAPEDMRGRYMAVYGFSWVIPSAVGPTLAGLVMDNADPRWLWYGTFVIGLIAAVLFVMLQRWAAPSFEPAEQPASVDLSSPEEVPGQV
ncbi:MAG: MFS transporter [Anaerolineae bacterium]|jgi:MFS family permease